VSRAKPPFLELGLLDATHKVLNRGRGKQALGWHIRREGIPLERKGGEIRIVHDSSSGGLRFLGQIGGREAGGGVRAQQLGQERRHTGGRRWRGWARRDGCDPPPASRRVALFVERIEWRKVSGGAEIDE